MDSRDPDEEPQAKATRLREEARGHKQAVGSHRRRAKEKMRELAEHERMCARLGIALVFEEDEEGSPADLGGPLGMEATREIASDVQQDLSTQTLARSHSDHKDSSSKTTQARSGS